MMEWFCHARISVGMPPPTVRQRVVLVRGAKKVFDRVRPELIRLDLLN
ncbi:MAG: hypothetical protein BWY68_00413 [bacterium ADurb.Bin400]|nr:MAG: hypothetical protein BWY68_00413 [bacterium ADurb.Bin400]